MQSEIENSTITYFKLQKRQLIVYNNVYFLLMTAKERH